MNKILFIDATNHEDSRTKVLANHIIEKLEGEITRVPLFELTIPTLTENFLNWRNGCVDEKNFTDTYFDWAKEFASADTVVIAAPYWDLSFPAVLKQYLEAITIVGLTFYYTEEGFPKGLCKAENLFYVTTAGGPIISDDFGFGYVQGLTQNMFGVKNAHCFKAENLDIWGADVKKILSDCKVEIDQYFE